MADRYRYLDPISPDTPWTNYGRLSPTAHRWLNKLRDWVPGAGGTVTLTAATTTTTLSDSRLSETSTILLMPQTANAAAAIATTYIATQTVGSATITHANNAQIDRTFRYAIFG